MMMKDPRGRIQPRDKLEELPEERSEELALKEARKKSWLVHLNKEAILIADSNDLFEESPPETMGSPPLTLSLLHLRFGPRTLKIQLSPLVLNKVRILPVLLLPRRKPPYLRSLIYEARHQHNLQCREEPVWELQDLARSQSWEQVLETEAQVAPLPQSLLAVAERRRKMEVVEWLHSPSSCLRKTMTRVTIQSRLSQPVRLFWEWGLS